MSAYNLPGGYDLGDSMMVDLATGALVDPLQFTATLTLASSAEHTALLESLSDAADLFLQRLPSEEEMSLELQGGLLPSEQDLISQRLGLLNTELKVSTHFLFHELGAYCIFVSFLLTVYFVECRGTFIKVSANLFGPCFNSQLQK